MLTDERVALQRLVVLVDEHAPLQGAFGRALDWAMRLSLPLAAVSPPWMSSESGLLRSCEQLCRKHRIPWQLLDQDAAGSGRWDQLLGRGDLCIMGRLSTTPSKKELPRRFFPRNAGGVLVCASSGSLLRKALMVFAGLPGSSSFLRRAVVLCRQLDCRPVVLTLAGSQRAASANEKAAREQLGELKAFCDFDLLVGAGNHPMDVARWRGCELIIHEQDEPTSWWSWLRGTRLQRLLDAPAGVDQLLLPRVTGPVQQPQKFSNLSLFRDRLGTPSDCRRSR
jgi:hypothetical protein